MESKNMKIAKIKLAYEQCYFKIKKLTINKKYLTRQALQYINYSLISFLNSYFR